MIIYSKFNNHYRKEKYQLMTGVEYANNKLYFFKSAQNHKAMRFLNSFPDKYDYLLSNNFSIKPTDLTKVSNSKVRFEYVEGEILEKLLFDAFQKKNKKKIISLIKDYTKIIKRNSIKKELLSAEFQNIFGSYNKKFDCVQIGCLDLNLDNIIFNKDTSSYSLIDYEWVFKFPIPYKYIIFRGLSSFYSVYNDYNLHSVLPLRLLYDLVGIDKDNEKDFIVFEYAFQKYVRKTFDISMNSFSAVYLSLQKERTNELNYFQQKEQQIEQQLQDMERKDRIIKKQISIIKQREQQIEQMQSSKFWKMRNFYIRYKSKMAHKTREYLKLFKVMKIRNKYLKLKRYAKRK